MASMFSLYELPKEVEIINYTTNQYNNNNIIIIYGGENSEHPPSHFDSFNCKE